MITAIIRQRIRKRQRTFFMENDKMDKQDEVNLIIPFDVYQQKKSNITTGLFSHKFAPVSLLIAIGSLLLYVIIFIPLNLYGRIQSHNSLLLPVDPFFEEAVFSYAISKDVRLSNDEADYNLAPVQGLESNLKIVYHQLAKGESVSTVAQKYKLNIDTLVSYNNIQSVKSVRAGTKLAVPNVNGLKYKVRRGDNLSIIANRFKISLNNLLDWNNIDSETIHPGVEYFIPGVRLSKNELNRILGNLFVYPVFGKLSSSFGWRKDPISGARSFHNGVDLANNENTIIKSAMEGTVAKVSYNSLFGNYIIIKHSDGFQTLYGHLNKQLVAVNQRINQGEKIGLMGNTGYSTGTHLHFAIFRNGEPVDPFNYLK